MTYLDLIFDGKAEDWLESDSEAVRVMSMKPSEDSVAQIKALLMERFPSKIVVDLASISFDIEMSDLKQQHDESLTAYYNRSEALMKKYKVKDRLSRQLWRVL